MKIKEIILRDGINLLEPLDCITSIDAWLATYILSEHCTLIDVDHDGLFK